MIVYSAIIQKGGAGKTTTAVNVAARYAQEGKRTLLVDLDPQATSTLLLGGQSDDLSVYDAFVGDCTFAECIIETRLQNLHLAPGHLLLSQIETRLPAQAGRDAILKRMLAEVADGYDVAVIDTPPSLGILPIMALVSTDIALVPLAPEELIMQGLSQVLVTIDQVKKRSNPKLSTRILLTKIKPRSSESQEMEEATRTRYGKGVFQTTIPNSLVTSRALSHRDQCGAVVAYSARSAAAQAYRDLVGELSKETQARG